MKSTNLLIIGAGGHGKAVAEAALLSGLWTEVFFVDDRWPTLQTVMGLPVVSSVPELANYSGKIDGAIAAVGNNRVREQWLDNLKALNIPVASIVHPSAVVSPTAHIDEGTAVMALAMVGVDVQIGRGAIINANATVDHDARLGDFAHLGVGVQLAGGVKIGARTWLQAGTCAGYHVALPDGAVTEPGAVLTPSGQ